MLALAFSPSSGSCQERLLVSQSPCQQGGYIRAPQCGHIIATEKKREPGSPLGARPPDGNTKTLLFSLSSIQQGSLSVICNKCPRYTLRDLEIITGWGPSLLLIGCIGPYQLRIFQDLGRIPIRKSLFSCQFKRQLKELVLILIGTSSFLHSVLLRIKNGLSICVCVCGLVPATCWVPKYSF